MDLLETNWANITLEKLFTHIIGGDWGKDESYEDDDYKMVSCIRGAEFKNWKNDYGSTAVRRKIKLSSLMSRCLNNNDILLEISGGGPDQPVGRTVLITQSIINNFPYPAVCTNFLRLMRPVKNISATYLNYFLKKFYLSGEVINYQGGSNNLRNLKFKEYSKINIPIPSINEQKIIAEKLDLLLAQVQETKSRLEQIPELLKQFRQSVLSDAVSGKLTEDCTYHSRSNNIILGNVLELAYGKSLPAKSRSGDGYPVYGSNGEIGKHKQKLVNGPFIIVGRKGSYGEITWSDSSGWPIDTTYYVVLKIKSNLKFIFYLLQTLGLNQLNRSTAIPGLNREDAYKLKINLPSIQEQNEIVRRVEQLFAYADKIEQQVNTALEKVNHLPQSILAKAFRGELTAQWRAKNPDLITGENSAASLLERIQVERAQNNKKKK